MRWSGWVVGLVLVLTGHVSAVTYTLRWDPVTTHTDGTPAQDLAGYTLYRRDPGGTWLARDFILAPTTTATDPTAPLGIVCYRVTAVDMQGQESPPSNEPCMGQPTVPTGFRVTP